MIVTLLWVCVSGRARASRVNDLYKPIVHSKCLESRIMNILFQLLWYNHDPGVSGLIMIVSQQLKVLFQYMGL